MRTDPYSILGAQLTAAATRQAQEAGAASSGQARASGRSAARRRRRVNMPLLATIVLLAGAAIAAAATGVLNGRPVPSAPPIPHTGSGAPARGGSQLLALRVADPEGGLPWGMRIVHTTRGLVCVQVGRVDLGQLGQLGIDGAFGDDGRFHALGADVLPTNSASQAIITCVLPSQSIFYANPSADRSGNPVPVEGERPPARELRSISFGLLGPHGVSVTYRTRSGLRTVPVSPGSGAYLIVEPVTHAGSQFEPGSNYIGPASRHTVNAPPLGLTRSAVSAITYRFGSLTCSIGTGAPVNTPCPRAPHTTHPLAPAQQPTQNLHQPIHLTLLENTPAACRAAYLDDPCYRVLVRFKAPYTVTNATGEYTVRTNASCPNTPIASWAIDRDIKRGETVSALSTSSFHPSACATTETLQIRHETAWLAQTQSSTHPPTIVGTANLRDAGP